MNKSTVKTLTVICIFSIAMAALEGAVVVYLRALYYPEEFTVAFKLIEKHILIVELVREIATLVMLTAIGWLAGRNGKERFAYFLLSFAVWDIFYYVWLKLFIDWPASLFDWDILFLIPFTWLGPVWAPVLCSLTMIVLGLVLLKPTSKMSLMPLTFLITGSLLVLYCFTKDYGAIIIGNRFYQDYTSILENKSFITLASGYLPHAFSWGIFWLGETFFVIAIISVNYGLSGWRELVGSKKIDAKATFR